MEISDSEEEEVVILHPEEPDKASKLVHLLGIGNAMCTFRHILTYSFVVSPFKRKSTQQSTEGGSKVKEETDDEVNKELRVIQVSKIKNNNKIIIKNY